MEILRTENLTFTYAGAYSPTIKNISVSFNKGEFITVCGATGSGKSTFLKMLKREITPNGIQQGKIYYKENDLDTIRDNKIVSSIGYVMQRPEHQIVTDKVWHELAFGLENLNVPKNVISRRIAEMASYFGIEKWFDRETHTLSGGQKQMLNLASVMVMDPEILILDEPTSQLDPIAASDFVATLKKINKDLGVTVIIAEHRLEELIPISDKLLVIDSGNKLFYDTPSSASEFIKSNRLLLNYMPMASRLFVNLNGNGKCPFTVREGREFIEKNFDNRIKEITVKNNETRKDVAIEIKNLYFKYNKNSSDILCDLNLKIFENETICILGGNGSGKTTLLNVMSGLNRAYSGDIKIFKKKIKEYKNNTLYKNCLSYLPQDVQTVFLEDSVEKELSKKNILPFNMDKLMKKHPYDLSGGEMQLVALAKVLETEPKILLLDEPTKGIDPNSKFELLKVLKQLKNSGLTIIIVTHDIEFAALCADRCALMFNSKLASCDQTNAFFSGSSFYTTTANKMSRMYYNNAVTIDDLTILCNLNRRNGGGINDTN